jgi:DUF1365 family protein
VYVLRPAAGGDAGRTDARADGDPQEPFRAAMAKSFFVSPFISLDGTYAVHVRDDADGVRIAISLRQGEGPMLSTSLVLARRPLTDATLLRLLLRHPLMTQRTTWLIHWHALRLWLRGAPFFRHGRGSPKAASTAPGRTGRHFAGDAP